MKTRFRILLLAFTGLLATLGLAALVIYQSMRQVPSFYQAAVEQDQESQAEANDQCLRQAAALASDVQRPGRWQAVFTADQINGWLAVDLVNNYPDALPAELENPRVEVRSELATLACGYKQSELTTVVSISFDLYLSAPNVVALRVRGVRAGLLPVPLSSVLDAISTAARNFDLDLEWRQSHGDPVAIVTLPPGFDLNENEVRLDTIELRDGEIYLAGQTLLPGSHELAASGASEPDAEQADAAEESEAQAEVGSATNKNPQR